MLCSQLVEFLMVRSKKILMAFYTGPFTVIFSVLMILAIATGQLPAVINAAEIDSVSTLSQLTEDKPMVSGLISDINEQVVVKSPLVSNNEEHGQLFISPFVPQHHLYPVAIISIDGWEITDSTVESELRLSEGEHQLVLVPDFSNIRPQVVFMASPWQQKKIAFTLANQQNVAVAARLLDREELLWEVQIYGIEPFVSKNKDQTNGETVPKKTVQSN